MKRVEDALAWLESRGTGEGRAGMARYGVSWALRGNAGRKSPALRAAAREVADRLAASSDKTARWIGRDAQKAFAKADG